MGEPGDATARPSDAERTTAEPGETESGETESGAEPDAAEPGPTAPMTRSAEVGRPAERSVRSSPATDAALALLGEFARLGVRDVVIAPGSRSQALALAAAEYERLGALRLHVRIDERSAAFLALGLALESGTPALVVTTSGTAVANLHPAMLEAHHSGVPLIALTADRPAELRGIRSNQTTMQPGIFAGAVRLERDAVAPDGSPGDADAARALARLAVAAASGCDDAGNPIPHPGPGPVHLNLQFREPLSAAVELDAAPEPSPFAVRAKPAYGAVVRPGPPTLVIAGAGAGPEAEELARAGGWPLLAEVVSGAHFGPNLVVAYRELLADADFGGAVRRVVVFGHPTLSREVPALVRRQDVETIAVAPSGIEWFNPGRRVSRFERRVVAAPHEPSAEERAWLGRWVMTSRRLLEPAAEGSDAGAVATADGEAPTPAEFDDYAARREHARRGLDALRAPVTRRSLVSAVWAASWPHDRLVLGASRLVRELDRVAPGKRIEVRANRGLSGIDGTVSTAIGVAIASGAVTRALIGDLTLLHDVGGLLIGKGEPRPRVQLVVGNDGGGSIFDSLEVAGSADREAFRRVQFTPQTVDLAALAAAYGWQHTRATTQGELDRALTAPAPGVGIVEVPLER